MQFAASAFSQPVIDSLRSIPDVETQLRGLLQHLSVFEVLNLPEQQGDVPLQKNLAVAANMVSRGLPTFPSLLVEDELVSDFQRSKRNEQFGTIINGWQEGFDFKAFAKKAYGLLHTILPERIASALELYTGDSDSGFEKAFLKEHKG